MWKRNVRRFCSQKVLGDKLSTREILLRAVELCRTAVTFNSAFYQYTRNDCRNEVNHSNNYDIISTHS